MSNKTAVKDATQKPTPFWAPAKDAAAKQEISALKLSLLASPSLMQMCKEFQQCYENERQTDSDWQHINIKCSDERKGGPWLARRHQPLQIAFPPDYHGTTGVSSRFSCRGHRLKLTLIRLVSENCA